MKKPAKSTHHAAVNTPTNSNRNTAPVVIDTPQKQQTAKEAIAANVQLLIEQLEQGHSEGLTAYLTAMGRFHNYSFGNIMEIARQKPDATRVAGLYAWNQLKGVSSRNGLNRTLVSALTNRMNDLRKLKLRQK